MSHTQGYAIAPMLSVRRGAQAVEFYKKAFGAVEMFKIESDDGAVVARLAVHGAEASGWPMNRRRISTSARRPLAAVRSEW